MLVGKILNGKYRIEKQLGRGGMGCVYLSANIELGNLWAIKHISRQESNSSFLLAEEEILKKLNHISLPKIIDVFYDEMGTYIVESYIEGTTLEEKLKAEGYFAEDTVIEWAKQLCEVLIYLHGMEPHPVIYRDMKPSNIIITRDNRAAIIDFGISREYKGETAKDTFIAGTCTYAAPEQLTAVGYTDQRTDIYSLGVTLYHLLTGMVPEYNVVGLRVCNPDISPEMDYIVQKCIQKNLEDRYQSAEELKADLDNIRELKIQNRKEALLNKFLIAGIVVSSLISYSMSFLGLQQISREKTVILDINPKMLVMTEQQIGQILVEKIFNDGDRQGLDNERVTWTSSNEKVAKVENGKVLAMNAGKAQITGRFKNKIVQLDVSVSERLNDYVNVNLKYNKDYYVETFAGSGERDTKDGNLQQAGFLEPTSMTMTSDGAIYVVDSSIRKIHGGRVETISIEPGYIEPKIIRSSRRDGLFIASKEWITENEEYKIGIFKLGRNSVESIYEDNGEMFSFEDFAFDSSGSAYVLERDLINEVFRLIKIDPGNRTNEVLKEDLDGVDCITINKDNEIYLSNGKYGTIYRWENNKKNVVYIAGLYNQKHFIDGKDNRFFSPGRIYASESSIYVIDHDVIRKLNIIQGRVVETETIAGQVSDRNQGILDGTGIEAAFGADANNDIIVDGNGNIYISDTDNSVIRKIYRKENEPTLIRTGGR